MVRNTLATLRYRVSAPVYYLVITLFLVAALAITGGFAYKVAQESKIGSFANKVKLVGEALHWEYRAFVYDGIDKTGLLAPHTRKVATLEGMRKDGYVKVRLPSNGEFIEKYYQLADLVIYNHAKAATIVNQHKLKPLYLDLYDTEQNGEVIVAWLDNGKPLNLALIDENTARPVETPPTNIVNLLMAAYLWKQI